MRLVYEGVAGSEVKVGDVVFLRDGEKAVVTYFRPPHSPASSGKINVRREGCNYDDEYYVGVIGAKWIDREDRQ